MESSRLENLRWSQKSERKYSQNCSIVHVLNIWLLSEETCPFCFDICKLFIALKICTKDSIFVSKSASEESNTTKRTMKDEQYNLCLYKVYLKETLILRLLETIIVLVYLAKSVTEKYNFFTWKIHFKQCPFFFWVTIDGECMWDERTIMEFEGPSKKKTVPNVCLQALTLCPNREPVHRLHTTPLPYQCSLYICYYIW